MNTVKHVLMAENGGDGGAAGGGASAGNGGQGQGSANPVFADANAARTFLKEYVPGEDYLKAFDDTKVVPFATHIKTKVDEFGKQFPADWRTQIAGENQDALKTLERFQSPKALYDSYGALRSKMASGELKAITPFPDKGTPEEQLTWRTANGIPESHDGYVKSLKLGDGVKLTEDDQKTVESFAKSAHAAHLSPGHFNATVGWFLSEKQARDTARAEKDAEYRMQSEDALRSEWQTDYRGNIARINALLDQAPQGVKDLVLGGRLSDGTPIGNHPATLNWLVSLSRQTNPAGVVIPGAGGSLPQSIDDEITKIEKTMKEDRGAYNKDEKMQARLRELYSARDKFSGKKAA